MRRVVSILGGALVLLALAAPAQAAFGLKDFDVTFTDPGANPATLTGSHAFDVNTSFTINHQGKGPEAIVEGKLRDFVFESAPGFIGSATAVPICNTADFLAEECSSGSVVGVQAASIINADFLKAPGPIYNLQPPPGSAARLGWQVDGVPIMIDVGIEPAPLYEEMLADDPAYNILASVRGINQTVSVFSSALQLWGVPADPLHDGLRGDCAKFGETPDGKTFVPDEGKSCPAGIAPKAFLTLPRACVGPLAMSYEAVSWQGDVDTATIFTHDDSVPPNPQGFTGCGSLEFAPGIASRPTTDSAGTSSGLDFTLELEDEGLTNPSGRAGSDIEKTVVTLPEGVTANPSLAEGLGVCTPEDLDNETLTAPPGAGCPDVSKIGTVSVQTPLLGTPFGGSVFLAEQDDPATSQHGAENPFDSLIAFYIVLKDPQNGILVKQPAKVEADPETGRLVTTVQDIPQVPFSRFDFHFREGQRAPLISPSACGTYTTEAILTPRARPSETVTRTATFEITRGVGGGKCPAAGVPPFAPEFEAGSINNSAKAYSPFYMRLIRHDGEQDMTKVSAAFPRGLLGKLAGVGRCPEALIELTKARRGRAELASPSCPESSKIGRTLAGAGVGSSLTFVPGSLYLAGPHKGAPLSVVSVTPAVAGPFDLGTVVVRFGLTLDPDTAEVQADGAASDPIPHILEGIPLKIRDLRVYVDRPEFTLNPTSCAVSSARATLFGSWLDLLNPADDVPVGLQARYQAANCFNLGFQPKLNLRLKGGTRRGDHPAMHAELKARAKDANLEKIVVRLPRSAFLDQAHIRTICTRVQFAAEACPKGARYGFSKVFTPLLDEPLEGPVYLRSSNHKLPDLVAALHGIVDFNAVGRIDSFRGGIRASFETLPDAPISKALLRMQGGEKGLIVNSRNLCARPARVDADFDAQNGRLHDIAPQLKPTCGGKGKSSRRAGRAR